MRNIYIFYVLILAPIGIIIWIENSGFVSGTLTLLLILFYALVYRTYIDGKRLANKKIIPKKDIWKLIIPGKRFKYFKDLYFK